jgi:hypothetical protein
MIQCVDVRWRGAQVWETGASYMPESSGVNVAIPGGNEGQQMIDFGVYREWVREASWAYCMNQYRKEHIRIEEVYLGICMFSWSTASVTLMARPTGVLF